MTQTCGELLIRLLESYGIDTVFGIPGVHTVELYRGLGTSKIRHITPRHEQGAGFMADGYARATGKPGVCFCITGPGMTNVATAMGQAFADSIPMLVISGVNQRETLGLPHGRLHEMKGQRETLAGVCGFSHTLLAPENLPQVLARAFAILHSGRPRPVHIEIPIDVMSAPVPDAVPAPPALPARPGPDPDTVETVAGQIAAARSRVLLLGGGAIDAMPEVREMVDLIGAPTALTVNASGLLPPGHPLLLGGAGSFRAFREHLRTADLCLAVGTELGETDYDFFGLGPLDFGGNLVRIDIDPAQIFANATPDVSMISDAALALRALNAALRRNAGLAPQPDGEATAEALRAAIGEELKPETPQYAALAEQIQKALPGVIIAGDSTKPVYYMSTRYQAPAPRSWFNSGCGFGTLGYGLPAAIGAQIGRPDRPVVAICGDGGFQFTLNELITAHQEGVPVTIIVWNNNCYREIRDWMTNAGIAPVGVDVVAPALEPLCQAMGVDYFKAGTIDAIGGALGETTRPGQPRLIEFVPQADANWN